MARVARIFTRFCDALSASRTRFSSASAESFVVMGRLMPMSMRIWRVSERDSGFMICGVFSSIMVGYVE